MKIARLRICGLSALLLRGCAAAPWPENARLPRPEHVYVHDFRAPAAVVNVDSNQFSYVMEGLDMAIDARSRAADAAVAQATISTTLIAAIRAMGLPAEPIHGDSWAANPENGLPSGNALIISGNVTNITEAIPARLADIDVGNPASQVNARSAFAYQLAGETPRPWRRFSAAAPVTPAPPSDQPSAGGEAAIINDNNALPLTMLPARNPAARTRDVALQARRMALRLAAQWRQVFIAEGWITPLGAPPSGVEPGGTARPE